MSKSMFTQPIAAREETKQNFNLNIFFIIFHIDRKIFKDIFPILNGRGINNKSNTHINDWQQITQFLLTHICSPTYMPSHMQSSIYALTYAVRKQQIATIFTS